LHLAFADGKAVAQHADKLGKLMFARRRNLGKHSSICKQGIVFAPTDEAFAAAALDALSPEQVSAILNYHGNFELYCDCMKWIVLAHAVPGSPLGNELCVSCGITLCLMALQGFLCAILAKVAQ
jgi:hypothetical protein